MDEKELVGESSNMPDHTNKIINKVDCSRVIVFDLAININPSKISIPRDNAPKGNQEKEMKFRIKMEVSI